MAKVLRKIKILFYLLLILFILGGGAYLLMYLNFFSTPAFLNSIPFLGSHIAQSMDKVSVVQYDQVLKQKERYVKDNERLEKIIEAKRNEMEKLQAQMSGVKKDLKVTEQDDDQLKEEIARLNEEILNLKAKEGSKSAAYKDMAEYFAGMKAKNAADIMSRLSDEDIIGIFSAMETDLVAELLENMDRDKAANISKKMLVAAP
ncbi:MAG: LD-carboxypeptidase [Syntrophomonas sp.]